MNEALIANWNSVIKKNDTVYYLGDFGLGPKHILKEILSQLNFKKIILIKGNHDKADGSMLEIGFTEVHKYMELKTNKKKIFMSHVPMTSSYHDIVVCGHCHDLFHTNGNIVNVGVDVNEFFPLDINTIMRYNLVRSNFKPLEIKIEGE